jgi:hypothetical protein
MVVCGLGGPGARRIGGMADDQPGEAVWRLRDPVTD